MRKQDKPVTGWLRIGGSYGRLIYETKRPAPVKPIKLGWSSGYHAIAVPVRS